MQMTLERQWELENKIKAEGRWVEFKKMIVMIYKQYRSGTLSEAQYLSEHARYTIEYAGEIK
jgi:hypothetical protein